MPHVAVLHIWVFAAAGCYYKHFRAHYYTTRHGFKEITFVFVFHCFNNQSFSCTAYSVATLDSGVVLKVQCVVFDSIRW